MTYAEGCLFEPGSGMHARCGTAGVCLTASWQAARLRDSFVCDWTSDRHDLDLVGLPAQSLQSDRPNCSRESCPTAIFP